MKTKHKYYMAGFFDGEGCIYINRQRKNVKYHSSYQGRVVVVNTKKEPLKLFLKYFGGKIIIRRKATKHSRILYAWMVVSREALYFCKTMKDFLLIKNKQAEIIIKLQKTMSGDGGRKILSNKILKEREKLYLDIRKLNKPVEVT